MNGFLNRTKIQMNTTEKTQTHHTWAISRIKSFQGREGRGFNATLLMDGKPVAFVIDSADGGGFYYQWNNSNAEVAFADYVSSLPAIEFHGSTLEMNADMAISTLVEAVEIKAQIKRWCSKDVVFRLCGDADGSYRRIKITPSFPLAKLIEHVRAKHGASLERIMNEELA